MRVEGTFSLSLSFALSLTQMAMDVREALGCSSLPLGRKRLFADPMFREEREGGGDRGRGKAMSVC